MSIITGDCLEVMKTFPDNHFSGIVTDPPYGLSFMGKGWDYEVPGREYWEECLRICKPGGHLLAMGGSRTSHRLVNQIESSGYQIRDTIMWIYGSGFPKSHNNFGIKGYGTALKPAFEPIIMAMKPIEGTFKNNFEKWGVSGINIDGCRIQTNAELPSGSGNRNGNDIFCLGGHGNAGNKSIKGRWPANLILDEEAAEMLDEQSGILRSGEYKGYLSGESQNEVYGKRRAKNINPFLPNTGGASRFFYCAKASSRERNEGLGELPDKQSRPLGISNWEGQTNGSGQVMGKSAPQKNSHPTVKPLALMRYLITLISPPTEALLLDPFAGSGSTLVAAKQLGIQSIGIEKSEEYSKIAIARIAAANRLERESQSDLFELESLEEDY